MWFVIVAVVALVAASAIAAASVLIVLGAAGGVGQLVGGRAWLGQLLVGGGIILLACGGLWLLLHRRMRAYRRDVMQKYELRKQSERTKYGTDVTHRAEQQSRNP
jgi:hypothetical protein